MRTAGPYKATSFVVSTDTSPSTNANKSETSASQYRKPLQDQA